jgi:hypothetical protein
MSELTIRTFADGTPAQLFYNGLLIRGPIVDEVELMPGEIFEHITLGVANHRVQVSESELRLTLRLPVSAVIFEHATSLRDKPTKLPLDGIRQIKFPPKY